DEDGGCGDGIIVVRSLKPRTPLAATPEVGNGVQMRTRLLVVSVTYSESWPPSDDRFPGRSIRLAAGPPVLEEKSGWRRPRSAGVPLAAGTPFHTMMRLLAVSAT